MLNRAVGVGFAGHSGSRCQDWVTIVVPKLVFVSFCRHGFVARSNDCIGGGEQAGSTKKYSMFLKMGPAARRRVYPVVFCVVQSNYRRERSESVWGVIPLSTRSEKDEVLMPYFVPRGLERHDSRSMRRCRTHGVRSEGPVDCPRIRRSRGATRF